MSNQIQNSKSKKCGFTVLEVLITILVITIGGLAAYAMVQQIVFNTFSSSYRITAVYLAKEGIENVRNIRDTNWLQGNNWDENIESTDGWVSHSQLPKYERKITIDNSVIDKLGVIVEVKWTERGDTHTVTVQENLYNWY